MEKGPLLFPKAGLQKAFEASYEKPIRWKFPVLVQRDDLGQARQCHIGMEGLGEEKDRLPVQLSDAGLGISLTDRLEQACGNSALCTIWLIGRWQKPLLPNAANSIEFFIEAVVEQPTDFSSDADAACVYKEVL